MIQYFGPWLIAIAVVYPVAFRVTEMGGKPVDVVLSDGLYLLLLLTPPRRLLLIPQGVDLKRLASIRVAAVLFILYSLALSLVGYAVSTELARVVSAVKFIKPMTFVLLGTYVAMIFPPLLILRRIAVVFAVVVLATLGTALANPAFPRCGWGQFLFAWETYGYPNSAMTFYGVMVPLLVAAGDFQRRFWLRAIYRVAAGGAVLLVVASLSRSSTISMAVALSLYLVVTGRGHIPLATAAAGALVAIAGIGLMKVDTDIETVNFLQGAIERRLNQTVEGEDPLAGRGAIWLLAMDLSAQRPVFGYAFESFSHYAVIFDTPHQQYLEIQYKSGLVGTALALWLLGSGVCGVWHLIRHAQAGSAACYLLSALLAMLVGTLVGNMSQPNLNYSLIGNTLFLMLGVVLTRHGAAALVPQVACRAGVEKDRNAAAAPTGHAGLREDSARRPESVAVTDPHPEAA